MKLKFAPNLSAEEKKSLEKLAKDVSFHRVDTDKLGERYESVSRQAAKISRLRLHDIEHEEAILLRVYGRLGLVVNGRTRWIQENRLHGSEISLDFSAQQIRMLRWRFRINDPDDVDKALIKSSFGLQSAMTMDIASSPSLAPSITTYIDSIIAKYSDRFKDDGYLYRVSTSHIFPSREQNNPTSVDVLNPQKVTSPGDIITDTAAWSTSINLDAVLYRYSQEGKKASKEAGSITISAGADNLVPSLEEVLYVIERNAHLNALDISGFKVPNPRTEGKNLDKISSGELLIQSRTAFRVLAIQKTDVNDIRRIVILRPTPREAIDFSRDIIRNPFNHKRNDEVLTSRLSPMRKRLINDFKKHDVAPQITLPEMGAAGIIFNPEVRLLPNNSFQKALIESTKKLHEKQAGEEHMHELLEALDLA